MGTSIFYFSALPPALVRGPLSIKTGEQRCKFITFFIILIILEY